MRFLYNSNYFKSSKGQCEARELSGGYSDEGRKAAYTLLSAQ